MSHLDYIYQKLNDLKENVHNLPYPIEDLRSAYFQYSWDILNNYYWSFCAIHMTRMINQGHVAFDEEATKGFEHHISRLNEITQHSVLFQSARNNATRTLLTDSWSNFEFCITIICDFVLDEEIKKELFEEQSEKVKKVLKNKPLDEGEIKKLDKLLVKNHLTHVSVNRKIDKLFNIVGDNYQGDKKEDKDFFSFLGRYRNCLHSNYIFHGNDFTYSYKGTHFIFKSGEPITHNKRLDIAHHFDLVWELNSVCERLFGALKYEKFIPCPLED